MKYMIFLLFIFPFQLVLGAESMTGFLGKSGPDFYVTAENTKTKYLIVGSNEDVKSSLSRLSNGDLFTGFGSIDEPNKKIILESVDYVGLRKLLGPWVGGDGLLVFKDFSTMKFSPRFAKEDKWSLERPFHTYQKEFRYTLSPSEGEEWALFLSDDKSTTFATVIFNKKNIIMKIYESESGNIVRTLTLERP